MRYVLLLFCRWVRLGSSKKEASLTMTIIITAFERSPDGGMGLARETRVRWALEEVGQSYEVRGVSFRAMKEQFLVRGGLQGLLLMMASSLKFCDPSFNQMLSSCREWWG